ncbi:MAG: hypothetical protein EOP76_15510 [Variovorax sp.]|nr:MAG: hypothetical protein EOP76_15510 [Variovorax sp.]
MKWGALCVSTLRRSHIHLRHALFPASPCARRRTQALFRGAAEALGARVAVMRSGLSVASTVQEVQDTARVLGRLYDAVECQGLDPALVACIGLHANIPVFDGVAAKDHPVDQLAELLGDGTPLADNRRFLLQALLLEAIA